MNRPAPAFVSLAPFTWEVNFGLGPEHREELRPELTDLLHRVFIDHPDYDRDYLPHFLAADIYLRAFRGKELAGHFISELVYVDGEPLLHLILGLAEPAASGRGRLMPQAMGLCLRLAAQAFGDEGFFVALRTANPRVVAKLWDSPWVRFYPRPDWSAGDQRLRALRPRVCGRLFGADRCSLEGTVFHEIYPAPPWRGRAPQHRDPRANRFCAEHLGPRDAFLFLGPTRAPLEDLPAAGLAWPAGSGKISA
ncbi:hypothetical protein [Desulfoferula mesophila]|uniref:N-acetyltransferase domain-containing protein n=1 Tax=Desulfoferula mesophila TaxID=3058419 RepID=A0AAU9E8Q2_9BACT|nr:hypothetical protein FAK_03560 [Desulfoferula mesophilus]